MNFDFSDEQRSLQNELETFLRDASSTSRVRAALEAGDGIDTELWQNLGELGWLGIAVPEAQGGSGLGALELAVAAEAFGRALAPVPFSTSIAGVAWAIRAEGQEEQKARWLPGLATGQHIGALALAEKPGPLEPERMATTLSGGRLTGEKIAVADGTSATLAIVACTGEAELAIVDLGQPGVSRQALRSLDPTRGVARFHFDDVEAEPMGGKGALDKLMLHRAVFAAFEQVGGADAIFKTTREFMDYRQAFGKPISSYQALKHRMADLYTAIELARSNAYYAAWALSVGSDELGEAACCAHIAAAQAFERAATEAIQLHGGIGFTWESDCQLYYRRAKWLSATLGGLDSWRERLVRILNLTMV